MATVLHLPMNVEALLPGLIFDQSQYRRAMVLAGAAGMSAEQIKYGNAALRLHSTTGNYVDAGVTGDWVLAGRQFTLCFWVYPNAYNSKGGRTICCGGNAGASWSGIDGLHWLCQIAGSSVDLQWRSGVNSPYLSVPVSLAVWTHVAFCYDGITLRAFKNGVLVASMATTLTAPSGTPSLNIGRIPYESASTTYAADLYIDDLELRVDEALHVADFALPDAIPYAFSLALVNHPAATYLSAFPVPSPGLTKAAALAGSKDIYYGGNGQIVGTTKNTPDAAVSRRVRLHESRSGHLIREGWSDTAGNYSFTDLNRDYTYYVVGFDHTDQYQGVVADKLIPEVMA